MAAPNLNLSMVNGTSVAPLDTTFSALQPPQPIVLNLQTTQVVDGQNKTTLQGVFQIKDGKLGMDANAPIVAGDNVAAFDFKYDENSGVFGAGTAFLKST